MKRVSTSFHETINLNLSAISEILKLSVEEGKKKLGFDLIKEKTDLGNNYVKTVPRYAKACGLIEIDSFLPTEFGRYVYQYDPSIMNKSTMWLMHYHLSSIYGPGPAYWNHIVTNVLKIGSVYDSAGLGREIATFIMQNTGDPLDEKTTRDSARMLLNAYTNSDGFSDLGLIVCNDESYEVLESEPPSAWVLGYALSDYWLRMYGDISTVNLSDITTSSDFAGVFFVGQGLMSTRLSELQTYGLLEMQRIAPPFQLVKLWSDKAVFLENMYHV